MNFERKIELVFPVTIAPTSAIPIGENIFLSYKISHVIMTRVFRMFERVTGVPVVFGEPHIAIGFRCNNCRKTFFAAEINDFKHECMD